MERKSPLHCDAEGLFYKFGRMAYADFGGTWFLR